MKNADDCIAAELCSLQGRIVFGAFILFFCLVAIQLQLGHLFTCSATQSVSAFRSTRFESSMQHTIKIYIDIGTRAYIS